MPSRYQTISTMKSDTGVTSTSNKTMYKPTYYPNIEAQADDNYILIGTTDRLDKRSKKERGEDEQVYNHLIVFHPYLILAHLNNNS